MAQPTTPPGKNKPIFGIPQYPVSLPKSETTNHTWFSRWKKYPGSIIGHIAQGVVAGGVLGLGAAFGIAIPCAIFALLWAWGFWKYQEMSFARKVNETGRGDTAGLDSFDFVVGFVPAALPGLVYGLYRAAT